ncbi:MAG: Nramp family divalent metal transporter [Candidatus Kapabacteria bacterium]|jgi:manganese transport protein|nr:Nramp family divalent metal transporter [Candidatus Kapabacteria bacterium]
MTSQSSQNPSFSNIHQSVKIPNDNRWKKVFAFFGPAYLVSVGYMDPGNWATDIEGGARFGYALVWVLLMSNLMAVLLQTLSARLGIVTGRDLAQACRDNYPAPVAYSLWFLAEIAIAACDLAEVLGTAIGINLLFHFPVLWGVIIAGFDTFLLLLIQNFGVRKFEAFIVTLVATIGGCFLIELFLSKPDIMMVTKGFAPSLPEGALFVAIGIIGATVMPHNLYLHSSLVQTRAVEPTNEGKRIAAKYNFLDSVIALNAAFFVNAAILILAASTFHKNGVVVTELQQAHELISPLLGTTLAGTLFAIALLAAGQSSTLTGTLAGQIVMEGFLHFKMRPFLRRLITRMVAIIPAIWVLLTAGETGTYQLLILSQVILSLQLPFAIIPLIHFTSDRRQMGEFASKPLVVFFSWVVAVIIIVLNIKLVIDKSTEFLSAQSSIFPKIGILVVSIVLVLLLIYIIVKPFLDRTNRGKSRKPTFTMLDEGANLRLDKPSYTRVGVTIAFSDNDKKVLSEACSIARQHNAELYLFHVVEGVGGVVYGGAAFDAEAREDELYLRRVGDALIAEGIATKCFLGFGDVPKAIVGLCKEHNVELLVMGGHGHRGLWDFVFGATISPVRHELSIPMLIVR